MCHINIIHLPIFRTVFPARKAFDYQWAMLGFFQRDDPISGSKISYGALLWQSISTTRDQAAFPQTLQSKRR